MNDNIEAKDFAESVREELGEMSGVERLLTSLECEFEIRLFSNDEYLTKPFENDSRSNSESSD